MGSGVEEPAKRTRRSQPMTWGECFGRRQPDALRRGQGEASAACVAKGGPAPPGPNQALSSPSRDWS